MRQGDGWPAWLPEGWAAAGSKHGALTRAIAQAVETGALPSGTRLPTHRDLARRLGVSVQTVNAAYAAAQRLGCLESVVGRGSFAKARRPEQSGRFMLSPGPGDEIDLSVIHPTYAEPHETAIRAGMGALARQDNSAWMSHSRPVSGMTRHREAGAAWLSDLGVPAEPDRMLVTTGATQGVFLALAAVARPSEVVLTEHLTESGFIGAAQVLGLDLRGVATDGQGLIPEALDEACAAGDVRAVVWVPTFGNPVGHRPRTERRRAIAEVARRRGLYVIEDEVYRPLDEQRTPSIVELLPERGFLATSFTKAVVTGLRVGYLVVPHAFALRVASILRCTTWSGTPSLAELASRWIEDGTAGRLAAWQRQEARARQDVFREELGRETDAGPAGALSVWLPVPPGWTESALVRVLRERRVVVAPSEPFEVERSDRAGGIRLCLSAPASRETLREALTIVRRTLGQLPTLN